jgi:hypothetical protein
MLPTPKPFDRLRVYPSGRANKNSVILVLCGAEPVPEIKSFLFDTGSASADRTDRHGFCYYRKNQALWFSRHKRRLWRQMTKIRTTS